VTDLRSEFQEHGFVQVGSLIPPSCLDDLYKTTVRSFSTFAGEPLDRSTRGFADVELDQAMLRLRAERPRVFGAVYDSVQVSASLLRVVLAQRVIETAAQLLGDSPDGLAATGQMLRMDVPDDNRNALDWHQEASYYEQNRDGNHGIVCWIAMRDVGELEGSMMLCPSSHKLGLVRVASSGKQSYESSEQLRAPHEIVARFSRSRSAPARETRCFSTCT
jgi:hypothetical protein